MDAKEKAKDLFTTYRFALSIPNAPLGEYKNQIAKQCALICVDEIENAIDFDWMQIQNLDSEHRYWQKVKEEIKKL